MIIEWLLGFFFISLGVLMVFLLISCLLMLFDVDMIEAVKDCFSFIGWAIGSLVHGELREKFMVWWKRMLRKG